MANIFDAHTHVDNSGLWIDPPETILERMDEAGIQKAVIMTYRNAPMPEGDDPLEYIADVCRADERLIGFARMNHASERSRCPSWSAHFETSA